MIHYIVGIGTHAMNSSTPGERYLDFILEYTDEEAMKANEAKAMSDNRMWKTPVKTALEVYGVAGLAENFAAISIRARYAQLMVCHFTSEDDIHFTREDLELIVKYKDISELKKAQILTGGSHEKSC